MRLGVSAVWRHVVWVAGCAALVLLPSVASAAPIAIASGSTLACFGDGCSTFAASVSHTDTTLGFTGVDLFHTILNDGDAADVVLGTFTRGRGKLSSDADPLSFTLDVLFSLPAGISSGQTTSLIGSIVGTAPGGGGPLLIDFDNRWHRVTTPTGAFEFAVLLDLSLNKNGNSTLVGSLRKVEDTTAPAAVAEPTTLVLLGLGLAGIAARRRRQ